MLTLNDGRSELWQWDTGRTLAVDADCSQVHFSNKVFGRSIDVDVADGVAIIPDVLLQTDKDLNVWAFVGTAENGYTKISKTFKVNRRNKPADYVFTPVEQTTINEIAAIAQSVRDDADAGLFNGADGLDGITPTIGENGNWYIGDTDTGKPSRGEKGDPGKDGSDAETRRKLDYIWKLNQGISYQFETDDTVAYSKTVPSGAKIVCLQQIGGNTEVIDDSIVNADVSAIVAHSKNLFDIRIDGKTETKTISVDIRETLYVKLYPRDISLLKSVWRISFVKKSGEIDYVTYHDEVKIIGTESNPIVEIIYRGIYIQNGYYDVQIGKSPSAQSGFSPYSMYTYTIDSRVRELPGYGWSSGNVYNSIDRTDTGWQYVQRVGFREYQEGDIVTDGVTTYYALDNPVITDITDLMADFPVYFEVEAGGTITLENAAKLPVPSTEKYLIALAEVNG